MGIIPAYAGNTQPVSPCRQCNRDHPRVCGEHNDDTTPDYGDVGSSPRMRGTPVSCQFSWHGWGIIPAYAGNTTNCWGCRNRSRDHPRICGEHALAGIMFSWRPGSSPRMRGTPFVVIAVTVWRGIIPAYAGNTLPVLPNPFSPRDHPRVCGEHGEIDVCMAGNMGSSPRMRGTRQERVERRGRLGIIPAYAGNTRRESTAAQYPEDHPRVCGEHATSILAARFEWGSSPRMRGTLSSRDDEHPLAGIIPAYAGNTTERSSRATATRDHPRVCGEHVSWWDGERLRVGSSPRMRGTLNVQQTARRDVGIIPAYAGNTDSFPPRHARRGDHPRVCGEHLVDAFNIPYLLGSSPRMRGTLDVELVGHVLAGIIPAYAGNT